MIKIGLLVDVRPAGFTVARPVARVQPGRIGGAAGLAALLALLVALAATKSCGAIWSPTSCANCASYRGAASRSRSLTVGVASTSGESLIFR